MKCEDFVLIGSICQPAYSFKLMTMSLMIHCVHIISLTLNIDQQELGECPRRSCSGILGHSVLSQHFQPQSKPKPKPKPRPSCTSTRYQCWPRLMPQAQRCQRDRTFTVPEEGTCLARRGSIAPHRPNAVAIPLGLLLKLGGSCSPGHLLQQKQIENVE